MNTSDNATPQNASSSESTSCREFRIAPVEELREADNRPTDWIWHGFVARRNVTLLTSQWKAGKTTLISVLLARMATGGELAGLPVQAGRVVVISEEDPSLWVERGGELKIGPHVGFLCRPFRSRPRPADWQALVEFLGRERQAGRLDLVVIDSLATFVPGHESDAATIQTFVQSLLHLAELGAAVLVLHHPKKGAATPGQAARGSGALPAAVDVIVEMGWLGLPSDDDRRRLLRSFSRHRATPRRLAVEWTPDGRDYRALGESALDNFEVCWPVLQTVLEDAYQKLTRRGILKAWPQDHPAPSDITLWRWLDRAVAEGRVQRGGRGRCRDPYRYWLTGQEERWKSDPNHLPDLPDLPVFSDFDLIKAAGNVMRNSNKINAEHRRERALKRKKKRAKPPPESDDNVIEDDDRPCYPFGEEARWIERKGRLEDDRRWRASARPDHEGPPS
jgi:hypothetical protein